MPERPSGFAGKDDIITYFVDLMKTPNTKTDDDENAKRKDKEEQDMLDRLQADRKRLEREGVLRDSVLNNKLIKNAIERIKNFYKKWWIIFDYFWFLSKSKSKN